MKSLFDLRLVERELRLDGEAGQAPLPPPPPEPPRVLARTVATPPGWPWDQTRGALLEARHGAPLPIEQMHLRLKRLAPWRPDQPARFAAFYARIAEITERFETQVEVEGRWIAVAFEPPQAMAQRARRSLIAGAAAAAVGCLLFVAVAGALLARSQAEEALSAMERDAAAKLRRAEAVQAARRDSAALTLVQPGPSLAAPLSDLAWAMASRDADARIEAWRWDHGVVQIESRGETPPVADPRRAVALAGAVRAGVQAWRIEPEEVQP